MRLIIALCLFAVAAAAPATNAPDYDGRYYNKYNDVQLLRYESDNIGTGPFRYAWEQSDGQRAEASGQLKNEGREDEALVIVGSYSWVGPDGVTYIVRYTADENGYQPEIEEGPGGAIPSAVLASLAG
ncbi:flexible cuticle protein 12-like [Aricia agestis]|uniref:flexible cuticle protein 12-like n=1 Tax=Aricia agestis TaxID=91739 RepID=UPI001C2053A7|nr:flexible cuticle protein 12-like [Aricia agestis]